MALFLMECSEWLYTYKLNILYKGFQASVLKIAVAHAFHEESCSLLLCNSKQIRAGSEYVIGVPSSVTDCAGIL